MAQKRNVYRATFTLPINLSRDSEAYHTLWLNVTAPQAEKGRVIQVTKTDRDLINLALELLETLPIESLQSHTGVKDRLKRLQTALTQTRPAGE